MFVDSHCHLDFPELRDDLPQRARRDARERASRTRCASASRWTAWPGVHALALRTSEPLRERRRASRTTRTSRSRRVDSLVALRARAQGRRDRRDRPRLFPAAPAISTGSASAFARTSAPRARRGKPLVIHTRAAADDTLAIMREERAGEAGGVMHCFTETWDVAQRALDLGFHISFSGIVTFKNAVELKDVARRVPLDAHADRNRQSLPRAGAASRQAQPAGVGAARRRGDRARCAKCRSKRSPRATSDNFFRLFGIEPRCGIERTRRGVLRRRRCSLPWRSPAASASALLDDLVAARSPTTAPTRCRRCWRAAWIPTRSTRTAIRCCASPRATATRARSRRCLPRRRNPNSANRFGDTPLMLAALNGHLDIVRALQAARRRRQSARLDAADLCRHRRARRRRHVSARCTAPTSMRHRRTARRR